VQNQATNKTKTTAADLRSAFARRRPRMWLYELAVKAHLNPTTLSAVLNEHRPLTPALAERIARAIGGDEKLEREP
jgi:plasmid maintenance system antidote protein VapI